MTLRIDPSLPGELSRFGGETISKCFNCGNCTAVCALSRDDTVFPRKHIRFLQVGAREKMLSSIDPWLCYYCGGCSDTCPRQAEPGELMMASRRWLTGMYDWTGLSRLMYKSHVWELGALLAVAALVLLLFTIPSDFGFGLLQKHPEAREKVALEFFAPKDVVHIGDLILAGFLSFFLLSNAGRMFRFATRGKKIPLEAYILELKEFVVHFITQKRWKECDNDNTRHWLRHVFLVTGYGTMFALVVLFLPWFQVEDRSFHWTSLLGYYSTLVLLGTTSWIFFDRLQKKNQIHKHSHLSDWLFIALLFLTSVTGILLHLCRLLDLAMPTYWIYMIHLMIAVAMLAIEVPFGKWSHLFYRPLAIYISRVQARADLKAARTEPVASRAAA